MASPPNYMSHSPTATSPPYQSPSIPRPKKRTAGDMPNTPTLKRRKASNLSVSSLPSAHPLRQTSFPPESFDDDARSQRRSPSVDNVSIVSGSVVSGVAGPPKKKRGRKKKDATAADAASSKEATPSLVGGKGGAAAAAGDDKEEEVDEDANDMHLQDSVTSEEQRKEETRLRALLSQALDKNQYARFEAWRLTRIPEAGVRRIINATVSQSVPQNAVLVTKLIAKIYIGDIIEIARQVQEEWMEANSEPQGELPTPPPSNDESGDLPPPRTMPRDDWRAPLRPEHLQEALRRYKAAGEGGHVGQLSLWHNQQNTGAERYSTRNSRKIFK